MLNVLIIDDDEIIRLFLQKLLKKKFGFNIAQAGNGIEGLASIDGAVPDLVFLDVTMPLMDGVETLQAIRNNPKTKDLPVIVLTAIGSKDTVSKLVTLGISGFILKPLDYEGTYERLKKLIEENRVLLRKIQMGEDKKATEDGTQVAKVALVVDRDPQFKRLFAMEFGNQYKLLFGETGSDGLIHFFNEKPRYIFLGEKLDVVNELLLGSKLRDLKSYCNSMLFLLTDGNPNPIAEKVFDGILKKSLSSEGLRKEFNKIVLGT